MKLVLVALAALAQAVAARAATVAPAVPDGKGAAPDGKGAAPDGKAAAPAVKAAKPDPPAQGPSNAVPTCSCTVDCNSDAVINFFLIKDEIHAEFTDKGTKKVHCVPLTSIRAVEFGYNLAGNQMWMSLKLGESTDQICLLSSYGSTAWTGTFLPYRKAVSQVLAALNRPLALATACDANSKSLTLRNFYGTGRCLPEKAEGADLKRSFQLWTGAKFEPQADVDTSALLKLQSVSNDLKKFAGNNEGRNTDLEITTAQTSVSGEFVAKSVQSDVSQYFTTGTGGKVTIPGQRNSFGGTQNTKTQARVFRVQTEAGTVFVLANPEISETLMNLSTQADVVDQQAAEEVKLAKQKTEKLVTEAKDIKEKTQALNEEAAKAAEVAKVASNAAEGSADEAKEAANNPEEAGWCDCLCGSSAPAAEPAAEGAEGSS